MSVLDRFRARRYAKAYQRSRARAEYAWRLVSPAHATQGDRAAFMRDYWAANK